MNNDGNTWKELAKRLADELAYTCYRSVQRPDGSALPIDGYGSHMAECWCHEPFNRAKLVNEAHDEDCVNTRAALSAYRETIS